MRRKIVPPPPPTPEGFVWHRLRISPPGQTPKVCIPHLFTIRIVELSAQRRMQNVDAARHTPGSRAKLFEGYYGFGNGREHRVPEAPLGLRRKAARITLSDLNI